MLDLHICSLAAVSDTRHRLFKNTCAAVLKYVCMLLHGISSGYPQEARDTKLASLVSVTSYIGDTPRVIEDM